MPIVLGVKGPRALGLAGEIADGVLCSVLAGPAHVRRVRAAAARRPGFAVAAYVPVLVDEDGARARDRMRPLLAHYLGVLHGQSILADAGFGPERTRPFREALLRREDARHLASDEIVDAFAVAGSPAECRQRLRRFAEAGLDALVAVVPGPVTSGNRSHASAPSSGTPGRRCDVAEVRRPHPDLHRRQAGGDARSALRRARDPRRGRRRLPRGVRGALPRREGHPRGTRTPLEPGMVFCVETPYYEHGWGGVQVEDAIEITATGTRRLTRSSQGLAIVG